jgi:hypothetical protein
LETGLVIGVPPHDEDTWEMQELSPADDEIEQGGRSGSLSPSTEGSSARLDSIWTVESEGDVTSATTVRQDTVNEDDETLTIRAKRQ